MAPSARESEKANEVAVRLRFNSWLSGKKEDREAVAVQARAEHADRGRCRDHAPAVKKSGEAVDHGVQSSLSEFSELAKLGAAAPANVSMSFTTGANSADERSKKSARQL